MARRPTPTALAEMRALLASLPPRLEAACELFEAFELPDFVRETEFVSLKGEQRYPWIGGRLVSSDGVEHDEAAYRAMTNEFVVPDNTTKWCKVSRESMAVGALARFNNNHQLLHPAAMEAAQRLGLAPGAHNPFLHNVAQLVELVHVVHESLELIDLLLATPAEAPIATTVAPRAGEGVGAVEAPRGILYHCYELDDEGRVVRADCVIPTTQNNANIHHDLAALVAQRAGDPAMTDERLELLCSMLVRAYDPCISCSVH